MALFRVSLRALPLVFLALTLLPARWAWTAKSGQFIETVIIKEAVWWLALCVGNPVTGVPWLLPLAVGASLWAAYHGSTKPRQDMLVTAAIWPTAALLYAVGVLNLTWVLSLIVIVGSLQLSPENDRMRLAVALGIGALFGIIWGGLIVWTAGAALLAWRMKGPVIEAPGALAAFAILGLAHWGLVHRVIESPGEPNLSADTTMVYGIMDAYHVEKAKGGLVFSSKIGSTTTRNNIVHGTHGKMQMTEVRALRFVIDENRVLAGNDTIENRHGDLFVLDPKNASVRSQHCAINAAPCPYNARYLVLDAGKKALITTGMHPHPSLARRNLSDLQVAVKRKLPLHYAGPLALDEKKRVLYQLDLAHDHAGILELNADTLATQRWTSGAINAQELLFHQNRLFVARTGHGDVAEYEPKSMKITRLLPAGSSVRELAAAGGHLYAAGYFTTEVVTIDLESGQVVGRIKMGTLIRDLMLDGNLLYAANWHGISGVELVHARQTLSHRPIFAIANLDSVWDISHALLYGYYRLLADFPGIGVK